MRKTITLFAAVAFFGGGLLTATEKLPRYVDAETTADWIKKQSKAIQRSNTFSAFSMNPDNLERFKTTRSRLNGT